MHAGNESAEKYLDRLPRDEPAANDVDDRSGGLRKGLSAADRVSVSLPWFEDRRIRRRVEERPGHRSARAEVGRRTVGKRPSLPAAPDPQLTQLGQTTACNIRVSDHAE